MMGSTITIGNAAITAPQLAIGIGSTVSFSGMSPIVFSLPTGFTADIFGDIHFLDADHRLTGQDENSVRFKPGSRFYADADFMGNAFGNTTVNSVTFEAGSIYINRSGSDPFAMPAPASVTVFQKGSLYSHRQVNPIEASGRTYANFEIDAPMFGFAITGTSPFRTDTLRIKNAILVHFQLTGGIVISGNLEVQNGLVNFNPFTSNTILFDGNVKQDITGSIVFNSNSQLAISALSFVELRANIGNPDTVSLYGKLYTSTFTVNSTSFLLHPYGPPPAGATGDISTNSHTVTNCLQATSFLRGMRISGPGIPANTFVTNSYGTTIEMSRFTTNSATGVLLTSNVSDRAHLGIGSPDGITAAPAAAGNIRSVIRSFQTDGTYEYNASTPQQTGDGLPVALGTTSTLIINNTAGISSTGVTLTRTTTSSGAISLQVGKLSTTVSQIIVSQFPGQFFDYSNASFVGGPVREIGHDDFFFPIGISYPTASTGSIFAPLFKTLVSGGGALPTDVFTAQYFRANPNSIFGPNVLDSIDHISYVEYWSYNQDIGNTTTAVTLRVNPESFSTNLRTMMVAGWTGTAWRSWGRAGYIEEIMLGPWWVGYVTSDPIPKTGYGYLTLSTLDDETNSPLPIGVSDITAKKLTASSATISWKWGHSGSSVFEVQRAGMEKEFVTIGTVQGTDLQMNYHIVDNTMQTGINYYRIKTIGPDGRIVYSRIVAVINGIDAILLTSVYPNIITSQATISIASSGNNKLSLLIIDMQGRLVKRQPLTLSEGSNTILLTLDELSAGKYHVIGISERGKTNSIPFLRQ
jgi:hypothetical protein